jgi:hypothetical protein
MHSRPVAEAVILGATSSGAEEAEVGFGWLTRSRLVFELLGNLESRQMLWEDSKAPVARCVGATA